ncbi:MAG: serine hydrolase domain-containing protein [Pseudomonadota bacterium]
MTAHPRLTRRAFGAMVGAAGLAGCSRLWSAEQAMSASLSPGALDAALTEYREALDQAAAGLVVYRSGRPVYEATSGAAAGLSPAEQAAGVPWRAFTPSTPFRVASQSKAVVALTALRLADEGHVDLWADVSPVLGFTLRHPDQPNVPITLAMLLAHVSGVRDPAAYWVPAPRRIERLVTPEMFAPLEGRRLGTWFEYANLNFGLAATVMEAATGERFDQLTERLVLAPAGLDAGFNWAGVSPDRRASGASLYRRATAETEADAGTGAWTVQTDGPETLSSASLPLLLEDGFDLASYQPGTNGTLFSPQGGLRGSLRDLAALAQTYRRTPAMGARRWSLASDGSNGLHDDRFFQAVGLGLIGYDAAASPIPGYTVLGHHGEAYGLHGAFWRVPDADVAIAYAAIGVPEGRHPPVRHPGLNAYTAPLAALGAQAAGLT